jgi:hypothetical protein
MECGRHREHSDNYLSRHDHWIIIRITKTHKQADEVDSEIIVYLKLLAQHYFNRKKSSARALLRYRTPLVDNG